MYKNKMKTSFITFCLLIITVQTQAKSSYDDPDYVAAVISYTPANKTTPQKIVKENLNNYFDLISQTKGKNVDILVFPEATLNYWGFHNNRHALLENAVTIPELHTNDSTPANNPDASEILREISKRAAENQMYILINVVEVVNCSHTNHSSAPQNHTVSEQKLEINGSSDMNIQSNIRSDRPRAEAFTAEEGHDSDKHENEAHCGKDGKILYNTNVVFDRNGTIVSKYRKFNLFNEKVVSTEEKPELATFTTDFGIQFGHFICFDIIFKRPAMKLVQNNVRHILYPTLWFSELPFITAAQVQAAWANANNVVLLASGGNNPQYGSSGSGIYVGKHGALKVLMSPKEEKRVMIAKVPKNPDIQELDNETDQEFSPGDMEKFHTEQFNVKGVHALENKEHCDDYLCCSYEISYEHANRSSVKKSYTYKAASAVNERSPSPDALVKEAYCAILSCTNERDPKECGTRFTEYKNVEEGKFIFNSIKITAKFDMSTNLSLLATPSTLDTALLPLNAHLFELHMHTVDEGGTHYQVYTLETKPNTTLTDFLTFGIHARIFTGADNDENGVSAVASSILLICVAWIVSCFI